MHGFPRAVYHCASSSDVILIGFLYTLEETEKLLQEVRVVREFVDVFCKNSRPPPNRKREFKIYLVLGDSNITKSAYRFAQKKLGGIKK